MKPGWKYGELSDVLDRGSSSLSLKKVRASEGNFPVYGAKGVVGSMDTYQQEKPYLAVIKDGAGIGRVSECPAKSSVLGTLQILIPKEGYDRKFLYYYLESIGLAEKYRVGSTIPHIYYKDYKSEPVPLVSLEEQRRIVALLDQAFEGLDRARTNTKANLNSARELFESVLGNVFEDEANGFTQHELQELCDVRDGTHDSPKYVEEGIPLVTQKNVRNEGLTFAKCKNISIEDHLQIHKRSNVAQGDILISMIGVNRGMACVVDTDATFSIKNVGLIKDTDKYDMKFLLYYLKSRPALEYVDSATNGGAQPFIGLKNLRQFPVPYIDLTKQAETVEFLDKLRDGNRGILLRTQDKLEALQALRQSLLAKAFAGELT